MKSKLIVTFVMVAASVCLGQKKAAQKPDTAAQLKAMEQKWLVAVDKADTAALDKILAPGYADTDENGNQTDKKGSLAEVKSPEMKLESIKILEMHVHSYGSAAVVTGKAEQNGSYKGEPLAKNLVFTDTFVRQAGEWRAVASQRTAVK